MNCIRALRLGACLALGLLAGCGRGASGLAGRRSESIQRALAISASPLQSLRARYVALDPPLGEAPQGTPAALDAVLAKWGWKKDPDAPAAWCSATGRLAFFREGWVWVTDEKGSILKSLWFEPSLQAQGRLRWSEDGAHLWIRADGWRRWLALELSAAPAS